MGAIVGNDLRSQASLATMRGRRPPMNDAEYRSLVDRDTAHLIHPQYHVADARNEVIYERGEGAVLTDVRGKQYIDGLSSLWNVAVGHGRKELAQAAAEQMEKLAFANAYSGYSNV